MHYPRDPNPQSMQNLRLLYFVFVVGGQLCDVRMYGRMYGHVNDDQSKFKQEACQVRACVREMEWKN
jgi:hypothetical protein